MRLRLPIDAQLCLSHEGPNYRLEVVRYHQFAALNSVSEVCEECLSGGGGGGGVRNDTFREDTE